MITPGARKRLAMLERVEADVSRELATALRTAQRNVAERIARAARDKKIVASERTRRAAFSAIGGFYDRLERELTEAIRGAAFTSAKLFHAQALSDIRAARGRVGQAIVAFDRRRVDAVWQVIAPDNGKNLAAVFTKSMADNQIGYLRKSLIDVWRQGDLEGLTLTERHREIQKLWDTHAGNTLANRFVDRAGRPWDNSKYLNMLVRTTSARVARDTYFDTLVKNGDDLAIIENVDGDACEVCQEWDGRIISITGRTTGYPSYDKATGGGWGHPNCRCTAERVDETVDAEKLRAQRK